MEIFPPASLHCIDRVTNPIYHSNPNPNTNPIYHSNPNPVFNSNPDPKPQVTFLFVAVVLICLGLILEKDNFLENLYIVLSCLSKWCQIDPSWVGHIELFLVPASAPQLV